MIPWHSFLPYCAVYAFAISLPGPGVFAIVARALGSGFRSTIPASLGTVVGDWVYLTLSVFGLAVLARTLGAFFLCVKIAGALYLLYLGWKLWTARVDDLRAVAPDSAGRSFTSQLLVTLGNPKAMAFFVALLPTVIDVGHVGWQGYLQLMAATAVLIPSILLTYAALASRVRVFLASKKARTRLNKTAAVIMAGAGVGVVVS